MSITRKEIKKEIVFFYYKEINSKTVDELITFCSKNPKVVNSRYTNGTEILLDSIKIELANNKPSCIYIKINLGGSVKDFVLESDAYYFFNGGQISSAKNIDDINFIVR